MRIYADVVRTIYIRLHDKLSNTVSIIVMIDADTSFQLVIN